MGKFFGHSLAASASQPGSGCKSCRLRVRPTFNSGQIALMASRAAAWARIMSKSPSGVRCVWKSAGSRCRKAPEIPRRLPCGFPASSANSYPSARCFRPARRLLWPRRLLHLHHVALRDGSNLQAHIGLVDGADIVQLIAESLHNLNGIALEIVNRAFGLPAAALNQPFGAGKWCSVTTGSTPCSRQQRITLR